MDLSENKLKAAASLIRLEIQPEEVPEFMAGLSRILSWVEQLEEVDTENVSPLVSLFVKQAPLREDEITQGGYADKIVVGGPDVALNMFAVPKVVE